MAPCSGWTSGSATSASWPRRADRERGGAGAPAEGPRALSRPGSSGPLPLVRLTGVTKAFREGETERTVLRDVTLEISPGSLVVLLGRSGSGKSTLLNVVSGMEPPTSGEVVVAGVALTRCGERERTLFRRRHLGFVFQAFNLVPTLSVEENVRLPLDLLGWAPAAARERAWERLSAVGLLGRARAYPERLSGGEQQRVALARALAHEPTLVLADEPTGNLDLETGRDVLRLLDQETRAQGRTLLMVTHSPEVVGVADRILRLQDGRLEEVAGR